MNISKLAVLVLVASLNGGCTTLALSTPNRGHADDGRTAAQRHDDEQLVYQVNSALVSDRTVPALGIKVTCYRGVITLRGTVPDRDVVARAVALAAQVPGVRRVDNRLSASSRR
jgi:hyperosmotically inducible protein